MSEKSLLSICIPTYNREKQLDRLLKSIVSQEWFTDEVSVVIADWPSKDNTIELVRGYQKKYNNIKYHRNEENIWMTKALLEVIWYSDWKYTWLIWSDDQLAKFSLKQMTDVIKKENPKLLLSNLFPYKSHDQIDKNVAKKGYTSFQWFEEMAKYMWSDTYNKDVFWYEQHFTFMSVFCFETMFFRDWLENVLKKKTKEYIDSNYFNYIYVLYNFLWINKVVLFDGCFILLYMRNTTMWRPNLKIYKDIKDLFSMINDNYSLDNNFLRFEKKISSYIKHAMKKWKLIVPIVVFLQKIWLYKIFSYLRRKYILKTI